jgi:hypothetical protein
MELKAKTNIKHNGKWYQPGEVIKKVKKEDGERLVDLKVAEEVEGKSPSESNPPAE